MVFSTLTSCFSFLAVTSCSSFSFKTTCEHSIKDEKQYVGRKQTSALIIYFFFLFDGELRQDGSNKPETVGFKPRL